MKYPFKPNFSCIYRHFFVEMWLELNETQYTSCILKHEHVEDFTGAGDSMVTLGLDIFDWKLNKRHDGDIRNTTMVLLLEIMHWV